jgi:hypothetical protein
VIADFDVYEVGADTSIVALATRSRAASERITAAAREFLAGRGQDGAPSMSLADVREPVALESVALAVTAAEARAEFVRSGGRIVRADGFDWNAGTGLASLGERTGAGAVLILSGYRYRPTANRVVSQTLLSAAAIAFTPAVILPGLKTSSEAVAALVDVKSGAILWANFVSGSWAEPDRDDDARKLVERLLDSYPASPVLPGSSP